MLADALAPCRQAISSYGIDNDKQALVLHDVNYLHCLRVVNVNTCLRFQN